MPLCKEVTMMDGLPAGSLLVIWKCQFDKSTVWRYSRKQPFRARLISIRVGGSFSVCASPDAIMRSFTSSWHAHTRTHVLPRGAYALEHLLSYPLSLSHFQTLVSPLLTVCLALIIHESDQHSQFMNLLKPTSGQTI